MPTLQQLLGRQLDPNSVPPQLKTTCIIKGSLEEVTLSPLEKDSFLKSLLLTPEYDLEKLSQKQAEALALDSDELIYGKSEGGLLNPDSFIGNEGKLFKSHSELAFLAAYADQLHREKLFGKREKNFESDNVEKCLRYRFEGLALDLDKQLESLEVADPWSYGFLKNLKAEYTFLTTHTHKHHFDYLLFFGRAKEILEEAQKSYSQQPGQHKMVAFISDQLKQFNEILAGRDPAVRTLVKRFAPAWADVTPLMVPSQKTFYNSGQVSRRLSGFELNDGNPKNNVVSTNGPFRL